MIVSCRDLIPFIAEALARGQRVRMTVSGGSMRPFIHDGDVVDLEPVSTGLRVGDVVLVLSPEGRGVLHRIVRIEGETFFLRGDAQRHAEGPFSQRHLVGTVVCRCRTERRLLDGRLGRRAALVWVYTAPLGFWVIRLADLIRETGSRWRSRILKWS